MEKIKSFLRKQPSLYRFLQTLYGKVRSVREYIMKTNVDEKEEKRWEERHLHEGEDWAIKDYWDVRDHPATHLLLKKIETFYPFSSILEIGCNCGPNLYLIAKKFPTVKAKGIDINSAAIQKGNELLLKERVLNVELLVGKAYDLKMFSNKSFDIVFTKAVLVHIGPTKIKKVIEEMLRIARRKLILIEQYCESEKDDPEGFGVRTDYSIGGKGITELYLGSLSQMRELVLLKFHQRFGVIVSGQR